MLCFQTPSFKKKPQDILETVCVFLSILPGPLYQWNPTAASIEWSPNQGCSVISSARCDTFYFERPPTQYNPLHVKCTIKIYSFRFVYINDKILRKSKEIIYESDFCHGKYIFLYFNYLNDFYMNWLQTSMEVKILCPKDCKEVSQNLSYPGSFLLQFWLHAIFHLLTF